jgi:hypothetical protein
MYLASPCFSFSQRAQAISNRYGEVADTGKQLSPEKKATNPMRSTDTDGV